ncbi:MAG: response regulator [Acidobacteriota bacterium]
MGPRASTPFERSGEFTATPSVLLVEDDPSVRAVVSLMLRSRGLTVFEAPEPESALRLARRPGVSLDLLITDIVMPGMSGLDLAQLVREKHAGIGCMFMSGFAGDSFDHAMLHDPSCYFIQKPFPIEELMRAIRIALRRSGQR